jgi:hypothetical protein
MAGVGGCSQPLLVLQRGRRLGWCLDDAGRYYLGSIPVIRANFEKVVIGIVFLSVRRWSCTTSGRAAQLLERRLNHRIALQFDFIAARHAELQR